jgi:hypothetical protein
MAMLCIKSNRDGATGRRFHYALVLSDGEGETLWISHNEDTKAEARKAAKAWARTRGLRLSEEVA